jgi:hypothetical protein
LKVSTFHFPDPNWWQARLAEDPCIDTAKLVPSRELEEKRKAFVPPEADYTTKIGLCGSLVSRKKKKELFKSKQVKWKLDSTLNLIRVSNIFFL